MWWVGGGGGEEEGEVRSEEWNREEGRVLGWWGYVCFFMMGG